MNFQPNTLETTKSFTFGSDQYSEIIKKRLNIKKYKKTKLYVTKQKLINNNEKTSDDFYTSANFEMPIYFKPLLKYNIQEARQLVEEYKKIFYDHKKKSILTESTISFISDHIDFDIMNEDNLYISFNMKLQLIEEIHYDNFEFLHKQSILKDIFIICKGYNLGTLNLPIMSYYNVDEQTIKKELKSYADITLSDFALLLMMAVLNYERALKFKLIFCKQ